MMIHAHDNSIRLFVCIDKEPTNLIKIMHTLYLRKLWHASRVKYDTKYNARMLMPHQSGPCYETVIVSCSHSHGRSAILLVWKTNHYDKVIFNCANNKICWLPSQRRFCEHCLSSLASVTHTLDNLLFFSSLEISHNR